MNPGPVVTVVEPAALTWVTSGIAEHVHDDSVDDSPVCGATSGTLSDDPRVEYTCVACRTILAADALRSRSGR